MIITRITQFFYLAAVHEQGSAQRNQFTFKLPSPDSLLLGTRALQHGCWYRSDGRFRARIRSERDLGPSSRPKRRGTALGMLPVGVVPSCGETPSAAAAAPAALAAKRPGGYIASGGFFLPSLNISHHRELGKKNKIKDTSTHTASQAGGIAAPHKYTLRASPPPSLCTSLTIQIFPLHIHT